MYRSIVAGSRRPIRFPRLAPSPGGAALRLVFAGALLAAALADPPAARAQGTSFMQPSITSQYLDSIRHRATTYRDDPFGTGETRPESQSTPYGTQGRGAEIGSSLFDFSRTEAALPKPYSTYDEIRKSALFPSAPGAPPASGPRGAAPGTQPTSYEDYYRVQRSYAADSARAIETLAAQAAGYSPYEEFTGNPLNNPYRSNIFQTGGSQGRFGSQSIDLRNRLPPGGAARTRENINLDLMTARLGLIGGLAYTDNALFARKDKTADLIGQMGFRLTTAQQITKENLMSFQIEVGYDEYILNPELNEIIGSSGVNYSISPRSNFAFETSIGEFFVRFFDSYGVTQGIQDDALAEAETNFTQFTNVIGIAASTQLNRSTSLTATLNRSDRIALDTAFTNTDTTSYNFLGDIEYSPGQRWVPGRDGVWSPGAEESWIAGLSGSLAQNIRTANEQTNQNDSTTIAIGPYYETAISKFTRVRVAGGIQQGKFDGSGTDTTDLNDFFATLSIVNHLNRFATQNLRLGHESGLSDFTNFFTADFVRHNVIFNLSPRTSFSTTLYLEEQMDSPGETQEHLIRKGGSILLNHQLNSKVSLYLGFSSGQSDSDLISGTPSSIRDPNDPTRFLNLPGIDVKQETFSFDIAFPFAKDIDMVLGYRRLATSSSDPNGNFVENRGSINFSYNF